MSINPTGIGWCTHSWNPFTGCCHPWNEPYKGNPLIRACEYCYAIKTAENKRGTKAFPLGFTPTFHPERIEDPIKFKRPAIIFADSMSDIFGDWWLSHQIQQVLFTMDPFRGAHWHKFVVLTKNPERMVRELEIYPGGPEYQENTYFGTSVTGAGPEDPVRLLQESSRIASLRKVHEMGFKTVISMEPLLNDPKCLLAGSGGITWADWIIIGGQTGPVKIPQHHWVINALYFTKCNQPVFIKSNAGPEWVDHQFPADLKSIAEKWGKA